MNANESKKRARELARPVFGENAQVRRERDWGGIAFTIIVGGLKVFGSPCRVTDERALESLESQLARYVAERN